MIENINIELNRIRSWCESNSQTVFSGQYTFVCQNSFPIKRSLTELAFYYESKNKLYKDELNRMSQNIFLQNTGFMYINPVVFGQILLLVKIFIAEEQKEKFDWWTHIHPELESISRKKFEDGHYDSAVQSSLIEISQKIRSFRKQIGLPEIASDSSMCRNTSKKEGGILSFTDCSTTSESDVQRGYEDRKLKPNLQRRSSQKTKSKNIEPQHLVAEEEVQVEIYTEEPIV